jgi:leader peptidase (prepilin peptidase)/N-methyltransferase
MKLCAAALFAAWCLLASVIDLRARRLPNVLTIGGGVLILCGAALAGRGATAVAGAAMLAGAYLAVHLVAPAALGAGDVKLAIGMGACAGLGGAESWLLAAFLAPLAAAVVGLVLLLRRRPAVIPYGPFMSVATVLALVATA